MRWAWVSRAPRKRYPTCRGRNAGRYGPSPRRTRRSSDGPTDRGGLDELRPRPDNASKFFGAPCSVHAKLCLKTSPRYSWRRCQIGHRSGAITSLTSRRSTPIGMLPPFRVTRVTRLLHACLRSTRAVRPQPALPRPSTTRTLRPRRSSRTATRSRSSHPFKQPKARGEHAVNDANGLARREPRLASKPTKPRSSSRPLRA